jgi:trehalose 6-phosphate synthase/phosphatase
MLMRPSSGGLATGLKACMTKLCGEETSHLKDYLWLGWPGVVLPEDKCAEARKALADQCKAHPVCLEPEQADAFYSGFCNKTIWPLFHYFFVYTEFEPEFWEAYVEVNRVFCDEICKVMRPGDAVWVHDYHLMLLPAMIRERVPDARIGFFLHIPFPGYETFRLLPREWGSRILEGLLGADLIGFHTHDYSQYFLRCVMRKLGFEHNLGVLQYGDRRVKVDTFPMGIDVKRFRVLAESTPVAAEKHKLADHLGGRKAILSVDRLDYSKGIIHRLEAYELFLQQHPEWHDKVALVMVVVPSRESVQQYDDMKQNIDRTVGRINGRFGRVGWAPILYLYKNLSQETLVAAYCTCDVALVTPLRDGMNLVAKEYVASRTDGLGVLILSEMAGAAMELGEALIINPNGRLEVANAIHTALEMPPEEQRRRNTVMSRRLETYDIVRWGEDFLSSLEKQWSSQREYERMLVAGLLRSRLIDQYKGAKSRLILTDYDGTLVGFHGDPAMSRPKDWLLKMLEELAAQEGTRVVLVSGRVRDTLDEWLGGLCVGLSAEHGAYLRDMDGEWQVSGPADSDWKDQLRPLMLREADRLPGSFVEEKDFSLVWHYRSADPELGARRALELIDNLVQYTANINVQVLMGNKVVEVRNSNIHKGVAGNYYVQKHNPDFILAIGDDWTDEDLFNAMPPEAWTVKVGYARSCARFILRNHKEVVDLLQELSTAGGPGVPA